MRMERVELIERQAGEMPGLGIEKELVDRVREILGQHRENLRRAGVRRSRRHAEVPAG